MAGSMRLVAKPDTWELRVFIGRDSLGKVKHRYVRFRGTRRQAERELARLVIEQEDKPAQPIELMAPARIECGPGDRGLSVPRCLATAAIVAPDQPIRPLSLPVVWASRGVRDSTFASMNLPTHGVSCRMVTQTQRGSHLGKPCAPFSHSMWDPKRSQSRSFHYR
jgi:hypothetical protein